MRKYCILFCILFLATLSRLVCQSPEPIEKTALANDMAKSRAIAFEVCDVDDPLHGWFIPVHQILYDGKPVSQTDTFQPGKKYDFTFQLKERKTVRQEVEIPPGEGPFKASVPICPLKEYHISLREDMIFLDGTMHHCEAQNRVKTVLDTIERLDRR